MDNSVKNSIDKDKIMKKGYILVRISVHNTELFKEYPQLSRPAMEIISEPVNLRDLRFCPL